MDGKLPKVTGHPRQTRHEFVSSPHFAAALRSGSPDIDVRGQGRDLMHSRTGSHRMTDQSFSQ